MRKINHSITTIVQTLLCRIRNSRSISDAAIGSEDTHSLRRGSSGTIDYTYGVNSTTRFTSTLSLIVRDRQLKSTTVYFEFATLPLHKPINRRVCK